MPGRFVYHHRDREHAARLCMDHPKCLRLVDVGNGTEHHFTIADQEFDVGPLDFIE